MSLNDLTYAFRETGRRGIWLEESLGPSGVFEDAVQRGQERPPRIARPLDEVAGFGGCSARDDLKRLQNSVHRRSEFMAHVGQEAQLDVVAFLCLRASHLEFLRIDILREVVAGDQKELSFAQFDRGAKVKGDEIDDANIEEQASEGVCVERGKEKNSRDADEAAGDDDGSGVAGRQAVEAIRHDNDRRE